MIDRQERWSYAAGDLGFNFVWQSTELYLLFFYVRGLGLAPEVASTIFLVGAAVDWAVDPLIGTVADRTPQVPLRVWVLIGGPLSVLLLAATFASASVGPRLMPAAALTSYLALRIAYGIGNIPYAALTARMSPLPADHLLLTRARMQGAAFGGLIATVTFLAMPPGGDTTGTDFGRGALLLSLLSIPAFLATALGVRERVMAPDRRAGWRAGPTGAVATSWRLLCRSAALRRLLATIFAAGLSVTVVSKSILFLFDGIGERRLGLYVALVPSASLLLTAPAWTLVGARLGRSRTLLIAAAMQTAAAGCALLVSGAAALIALTCLAIVAGCGMSIMFWTLVPGVIAECEGDLAASGCAGRVYALANMARKLAQALAPQVIALTLVRSTVSTVAGVAGCAVATMAVIAAYRPRGASDRRLDVGAVPIERGMAG